MNKEFGQATTYINGVFALLVFTLLVLSLAFEIYNLLKKIRPWGVVYDSRNKKPVGLVTVRLFDAKENKILQTVVTDTEGRYNFLVQPGSYYLNLSKENYHFPSRIISGNVDGKYSDLYYGKTLKVVKENAYLSPDIPIDSYAEERVKMPEIWSFFRLTEVLRLPILVITTILTFLGIVILQSNTAWLVLLLLIIIWVAEIYFAKRERK